MRPSNQVRITDIDRYRIIRSSDGLRCALQSSAVITGGEQKTVNVNAVPLVIRHAQHVGPFSNRQGFCRTMCFGYISSSRV